MPGGGWRIESLTQRDIPGLGADGSGRAVNRVEIAMGDQRQLVYYWFAQRGRVVTNEFAVKGYILWDGLTKQRTDGALVRIATYVGQTSDLPAADTRLEAFMRAVDAPWIFTCLGRRQSCAWPRRRMWRAWKRPMCRPGPKIFLAPILIAH